MNVSIQHLIASVAASLEKEVLPHLAPDSNAGSSVRACLMILAYIEQRSTCDAKWLYSENQSLRALLRDAAVNADRLGLDPGLRSSIMAATTRCQTQSEFFDVQDALNENENYREILTGLIKALAASRAVEHSIAHKTFRTTLHLYLDELSRNDFARSEKALKQVPI